MLRPGSEEVGLADHVVMLPGHLNNHWLIVVNYSDTLTGAWVREDRVSRMMPVVSVSLSVGRKSGQRE